MELSNKQNKKSTNIIKVIRDHIKSIIKTLNAIKFFTIIITLPSMPLAMLSLFFSYYLVQLVGLDLVVVGLFQTICQIVRILFNPLAGIIVDKIGEKNSLIINFSCEALSISLFLILLPINKLMSLIVFALSKVVSPLYASVYATYIGRTVSSDELATIYGGIGSLTALIAMITPLMGSYLWSIDPTLIFIAYILCYIILVVLAFRLK